MITSRAGLGHIPLALPLPAASVITPAPRPLCGESRRAHSHSFIRFPVTSLSWNVISRTPASVRGIPQSSLTLIHRIICDKSIRLQRSCTFLTGLFPEVSRNFVIVECHLLAPRSTVDSRAGEGTPVIRCSTRR
ncbi:hypothetical protein J6590_044898 [Homalodisca vitripennis]|nr:hypothetical protein J6590_044898 [Homalodisca vitripennis]